MQIFLFTATIVFIHKWSDNKKRPFHMLDKIDVTCSFIYLFTHNILLLQSVHIHVALSAGAVELMMELQ